ncbi:MAG TPA: hypothetical protein VK610_03155 [Rhodothermales bacterium]|nr:hypothetical protein [Rhodothermales bacterium]
MRPRLSLAAALLVALLSPAPRAQAPAAFPALPENADRGTFNPECVERAGTRVCRQFIAGEGDDQHLDFIVTRDGRETARWTEGDAPGRFTFAAFDAGGTLLVANFEDMSNGLGVRYWTVYVVPPGARTPTYRFAVRDFGDRGGSFAAWRGRPVVWATDWLGGTDPSGRRGSGLYFVGRPFVIGTDGLEPATGVPLRARRYLDSFADQRGEGDTADPRAWLFDRRAEVRTVDLALAGCRRATDRAAVRTVAEEQGTWSPYLVLTLADGRRLSYGRTDGGGDDPAPITHLGSRGRLFPQAYRPSDLPARLTGRTVRVETCTDTTDPADAYVRTRVLWLE